MKRAQYLIYGHFGEDIFRLVKGYIFPLGSLTLGCRKEGDMWEVTEITTGLKVNNWCIKTKAEVLPSLLEHNAESAILNLFGRIKPGDAMDLLNQHIQTEYERLGIRMPVL